MPVSLAPGVQDLRGRDLLSRELEPTMLRNLLVVSAVILLFDFVPSRAQSNNPDPLLQQDVAAARDLMAQGKNAQAVEAFSKLTKQHKDCAVCWLGMGYGKLRLNELDEAEKYANKALALSADNSERAGAHNLKGEVFLAGSPRDAKDSAKAEEEFRESLKLAPEMATFHLNLARALLKQSRDEEASAELKQCLSLHPAPAMADTAEKLLSNPKRGREDFVPDFQFTTLRGDQISSQQLAGKMVVMDFWATWCPPCRESVPELRDLAKKYPGQVVLISVSADSDDSRWREFIAKHDMTWHQYRDADHKIAGAFGVHAFPTYLVIGGDGAIEQRIVGMNPQETVVHRLKQFLANAPELAAK